MRRNQGFTLIELMVVMAIIAILATAGLSAYGGYLKKARDATRLEDMRALENIANATLDLSGQAASYSTFIAAVSAMNNGVILKDPMDNKNICVFADKDPSATCLYEYFKCQNGGYALRVRFESVSNIPLYAQDKLIGSAVTANTYDIGNCDTLITETTNAIRP